MGKITKVWAEVIHDSRGDDTIQVSVKTDSEQTASAAIPAGASKGKFEAAVVPPAQSVELIASEIQPALIGQDPANQLAIDQLLINLDGTPNKQRLGANTLLGVSMAVSRVASVEQRVPLYRYIAQLSHRDSFTIPIPMFNLINGGKHADNNLDIQEFMVIPDKVAGYHNQLSAGQLIFNTLGQSLRGSAAYLPTGDEGGYAPNLDTNEMALGLLMKAIKDSGYQPWDEVSLGLDIAASSLPATFELSATRYLGLLKDFPIMSLEDPFNEEDWSSWSNLKHKIDEDNPSNKKIMLVGDDLFATNLERLQKGIQLQAANSILVKLNQIGSVSETLAVVEAARQAGYIMIVSHRSGETLDDYIADFAVGVGAQFIKTGAPNENHPERMSKYRRLLKIEQELSPTDGRTTSA